MNLQDAIARGRAAWPSLAPDDDAFAAFLLARGGDLATLMIEDLYLAWACLRGDPAALRAFDRSMAEPIRLALAKINASDALKQDAIQRLRERLFVGDKPRIAEFEGRGQLRRWVQAAVARVCLDQLRNHKREIALEPEHLQALAPQMDPELEHLRRLYGPVFQVSFEAAIDQLAERERAILRHHLVEGLTIDDIGARYSVSRATAFRWIERAREALIDRTRDEMMKRLRVQPPEIESILRVIRSEVHLSLPRLLAAQ